jgi:copper(I)-binding protein
MRFNPAAIATAFIIVSAGAASAQAADITASDAWSRPTASASMAGVVYATLTDGGEPDRLLGVRTPIADHADMHQSREVNGVMEMLSVKTMAISRKTPIHFSPNNYHVMLTGLHQPLSPGQSFPLTFNFASGTRVTTTVKVLPMGAPAPGGSTDDSMAGMKM